MSAGIDTALRLAAKLTSDDLARAVQLGIEYDPHPPHGGIDWSRVDRDMLAAQAEGYAREALAEDPAMLSRLLGDTTGAR